MRPSDELGGVGLRHHPVLLRGRALRPPPRRARRAGCRQAGAARHHADHQRWPGAADGGASGAAIPSWLVDRLDRVEDPVEVRRIGVDVASTLCAELLELGAPGLHLYTLNRSTASREIYANLGLPRLDSAGVSRERAVTDSWRPVPSSGTRRARRISRVPVPARARWHAGPRRGRGDGVPRQPDWLQRRVPRRRGVLRHLRLPDHAAADRRARAHGHGQPAGSSGSAGPAGCCRRCS